MIKNVFIQINTEIELAHLKPIQLIDNNFSYWNK